MGCPHPTDDHLISCVLLLRSALRKDWGIIKSNFAAQAVPLVLVAVLMLGRTFIVPGVVEYSMLLDV